MTTIPQVARAMREILTTTAAAAGRATRFVQRTSPLHGATFSQTLVFGLLGHPQATLEALTQTAAALGIEISPQALDQRLKMFQTCGSATLSASERTINASEGSDDHPSAALPLLPRN
jgi:hypothetical protein